MNVVSIQIQMNVVSIQTNVVLKYPKVCYLSIVVVHTYL